MEKSNKQSGFSLMEIMIAAALMGGLALAVAKLMQDQSKAVKTIESRAEYNSVITDIRNTLSLVDSCMATMGGLMASGDVLPDIKYKPDPAQPHVVKYTANELYGNGNVKMLAFRIGNHQMVGTTAFGTTQLEIDFEFNNNTGGTKNITRRASINIETESPTDLRIKHCYATGGAGLDSRYLQREGDLESRTMRDDLIMSSGTHIIMEDGTGTIQFLSDARLKHEVQGMKKVLPKLRQLRPSTYKWISDDRQDLGLIAQELRAVFPNLVRESEEGYYTVDYIRLTPLLLKGIQEVDKENVYLKKSLNDMKIQMEKMNKDIQLWKKHSCKKSAELTICK